MQCHIVRNTESNEKIYKSVTRETKQPDIIDTEHRMNEYDLSDAITETVAAALNKIKFYDGVECLRGNDAANR